MKKRVLIILLILVGLLVGTYFYINAVFLPIHLRTFLTDKAEDYLKRSVAFKEIKYSLTKGVIVDDLTIYEKESTSQHFLFADELSFSIIVPNIFKRDKIIINSLSLNKPIANIIRTSEEKWSFSDLLNIKKKPGKEKDSPLILIGSISIKDGLIRIDDQTATKSIASVFESIDFKAKLSIPKDIKYTLSANIPQESCDIKAEGKYGLINKTLTSKISTTNFNLSKYLPYLYKNNKIKFHDTKINTAKIDLKHTKKKLSIAGSIDTQAKIFFDEEKMFSGHINSENLSFLSENKKISIQGPLFIKNPKLMFSKNQVSAITLDLKNGLFIKEKDKIDLTGKLLANNMFLEFKPKLSLKGNIDSSDLTLHSDKDILTFSSPIKVSETSIVLGKNKPISIEELEYNTFDTSIDLKGKLSKIEKKELEIQVSTKSINLRALNHIFREDLENLKVVPSGEASFDFRYNTLLNSDEKAKISVTTNFKNCALDAEKLSERIVNISGGIEYSDITATWDNIKATFKNKEYTSKGNFVLSLIPILTTQVSTENFDVSTKVKFRRSDFFIPLLSGKYHNSSFDVKGEVKLSKESGPKLDMKGDIELDLKDMPLILPEFSDKLKTMKTSGILSSEITYRGSITDFPNSIVNATAKSDLVSVFGYKLNKVQMKFEQGDKPYSRLDTSASTYDGIFDLIILTDPDNMNTPYRASVQIKDIDIAKLAKDTPPIKDKNVSGKLSAGLDAAGLWGNIDSIQGNGKILVKDGNLYEFNLLKGLFKLLFISDFENIVFTEGHASFIVKDRFFSTSDFTLISDQVELVGNGWMDFDKNIDIIITPDIQETEILLAENSIKTGPTVILSQAQEYFNVRISGSLDEPQFKIETLPQRIIQDTTGAIKDIFIDGMESIFEDLF